MPTKKGKNQSLLSRNTNVRTWQVLVFLLAFAGLGTYAVLVSSAAPLKGSAGKVTGSISLSLVNDLNGDGLPNRGDTISFNQTSNFIDPNGPWVDLSCTQNGAVVYGANTGYGPDFPWPWTREMLLSSDLWKDGAINCHTNYYYVSGKQFRHTTLSTLDFIVNP